ncbi:MAG TPA: DapH/DapD/GlmU-related protein [Streptosporangiaceae bacterium]|nr:DapH/DapD/GlmU-related protein [Streptosporangiaceae bacterium]
MPGKGTLRALAQRAVHWAWQAARDAGAVTADSPAGRKFAAFGPGSILVFPAGAIFGEPWIEIGTDTVVGQHVTISAGTVPGQDLGATALLRIGDRCVIGRGSHIVAHQRIDIGDDVFTGPYVYITDQNHGYADPTVPIGRQWPANAPVSIGAGSWLGAGAIVLPGSRIGRNVVVGAGSVVRGHVPDHCVVAGVPARVVRSYRPGDGWRPTRSGPGPAAAPTGTLADVDGALAGPATTLDSARRALADAPGALADPEGVQGVPEPPHPVL